MISEKCSCHVLECVHFCGIHDRFLVGGGNAQIEGGHNLGTNLVFPGYVYAWLQFVMINGKAGYFFHDEFSFYVFYDV